MMKKILVVGSKGMAGHVLKTHLESLGQYEVWGIARGASSTNNEISLDVSEEAALKQLLLERNFNVVVNCVGVLNRNAEDNPWKAIWYNSYFPHLLELWGTELHFKLIHISTDCVFSGKSTGGYTESSFKDGIGYYAQSKALGEVVNEKDLTFRTSIIGPELKKDGIGLFHWFMQQGKQASIKGFTEVYWTGVTTMVLAEAVVKAIESDLKGLYHLVNNDKISKFQLVSLFNTVFRRGQVKIAPDAAYKVDKSLVNTRADFDFTVPAYESMIAGMKAWMEQHPGLYKRYT